MRFRYVKIKNFGPFKEEVTLLLSDQGMVLILGDNKDEYDSNGSGKSTLLEAITWCIWGKPLRKLDVDEVINRFTGKDCQVTVAFTDDNEYVVTRTRGMSGGKKSNDLVFTVNGIDATTGGMKLTQERINKAVGLDFDTFRAMMPGAGLKAAAMTDKEIKDLLEDVLQTRVISEAMDLAKAEVKELDKELSILDKDLERVNDARYEEMDRYNTYEERDRNFEEDRDFRIRVIQAQVAEQMNIIEASEKVAKKWQADKDKLDAAKVKLKEATEARKAAGEVSKAEQATRLALLSAYDKEAAQFEGELKVLARAAKDVSQLGDICVCCHQPITEAHRVDLVYVANSKVKSVEALIAKSAEGKAKTDKDCTARVTDAQTKYKNCVDVENALELKIGELAKGETAYTVANERWKTAKARIKELSAQQEGIQAEVSPFKDLAMAALAKATEIQKNGDALVIKERELKERKKDYQFWVDGFSPAGLRSYMLEHVTPVLNARAEYYSDLVTNGNMKVVFNTKTTLDNGEVREKFNIEVHQKFGGASYNSLSAGEKARADLIIAFALGDLASLRANKLVPFRFLDEPFESMDDTGTEAVVKLLNDQREKYNTVYVITHKDHFKQLFKNRLTVVKKDGCSTLEYKYGE